jgi:hypothetical protein
MDPDPIDPGLHRRYGYRARGLPVGALLMAMGLALAGWWIGHGFMKGRAADRFVTVKGVSEREVKANIAFWYLRYTAADNNLAQAQARIQASTNTIRNFLLENGIRPDEISFASLEVNDVLANPWRGTGQVDFRYVVNQGLLVRSDRPDTLQAASQKVGELVDAGVILGSGGGPAGGPTFLFTKLNDLKPEMIAEATASARQAAEQFAKDSQSHLGGIRQANQGVFVILPRYQTAGMMEDSQMDKTVRVVTTVEYYLRD